MTDASTTASAALTTANDAKRIAEAAKTSSGEAKNLAQANKNVCDEVKQTLSDVKALQRGRYQQPIRQSRQMMIRYKSLRIIDAIEYSEEYSRGC